MAHDKSPIELVRTNNVYELPRRASHILHASIPTPDMAQTKSSFDSLWKELFTKITIYLDPIDRINLKHVSSSLWRRVPFAFRQLTRKQAIELSPLLLVDDRRFTSLERKQTRFIQLHAKHDIVYEKLCDEYVTMDERIEADSRIEDDAWLDEGEESDDPDALEALHTELDECDALRKRVYAMEARLKTSWERFKRDGLWERFSEDGRVELFGIEE